MLLRSSIVVVSRGRPELLLRCLSGVAQLDHPDFEVIVVACPEGVAAVQARDDAEAIKLIPFDEPNISVARNLGVAEAAGQVVAFIDDDAVPEPMWLRHLTAPLAEGADCTGGYVLGRNGISLQWGARQLDCYGVARPLPDGAEPEAGQVLKTEGTNMALRREVFQQIGGFDPRYHFYMDETDLNWRLGAAGYKTVLVPDALVHHGFAASPRRTRDRIPTDLTEIGASTAVFLEEFAPKQHRKRALRLARAEQKQRLLRLMQQGPLGADDVLRLMRGFDRGAKEGLRREPMESGIADTPEKPFLAYPSHADVPRIDISARAKQRETALQEARQARQTGAIVSLYLFSRTALYHRVRFTKDGIWEQTGGQFGKSERSGPMFKTWRFKRRVEAEIARSAKARKSITKVA